MKKIEKMLLICLMVLTVMFVFNGCGNSKAGDDDKEQDEWLSIEKPEPGEEVSFNNGKKTLDVFQGIELVYSGANGAGIANFDNNLENTEFEVDGFYFKPLSDYQRRDPMLYGYSSLNVIYDNQNICYIKYSIEDWDPWEGNLKKGDKVVVTAEIKWPEAFDELEYTPLLRKEYIVPDLGEFLTEKKEFTTTLVNEIENVFLNADSNVCWNDEVERVTIEKAFLSKAKPGTEILGKSKVGLIAIVKRNVEYYIVNVYDIYRRGDVVDFSVEYFYDDSSYWQTVYSFETLEEAENELNNIVNDEYDYEEIE